MTLALPTRLAAQSDVLLQGIADLELWKTDARSVLLAPAATVHLWTAWELPAGLTLYALGEAEGGGTWTTTDLRDVRLVERARR